MSDTPLSKLLKQGSSLTSYNIGQVAKLEAQIADLTAKLAEAKAKAEELGRQNYQLINELAETNAAFSEAVHMHQQERAALSALLEKAEAERDAALRNAAILKNALYRACGNDKEVVESYIESETPSAAREG